MTPEAHTGLDKAQDMLNKAQSLNDNGKAPASIEMAYDASNEIAVVYMREVAGRNLPPNDEAYYQFSKAIQQLGKHPKFADRIAIVVRVVFVLHEAYEPNLLGEATKKDAQQMIDHVAELRGLIEDVLR